MSCPCRCHAGGPHASCDVDGGHGVGCGPHAVPLDEACVLAHPNNTARFVGLLCRRHYHWVDRMLAQILELFAVLDDVIVPGPSGETRTATRTGSPAPGSLDAMAITDHRARAGDEIPDLPGTLASWARMVVEERAPAFMLDGTVVVSVRLLRRERHWIASQPWVDDYTDELAALHRAVARAARDTMWPRSIGACPNCGTPLFNTIGADEVTCRRCRTVWSGVDLARLRLIHEQEGAR